MCSFNLRTDLVCFTLHSTSLNMTQEAVTQHSRVENRADLHFEHCTVLRIAISYKMPDLKFDNIILNVKTR